MSLLKSLSPRRSMRRVSAAALASALIITALGMPTYQVAAVNYTLTTCNASELRSTFQTANNTVANDTIFLKAGCDYTFTDSAEGGAALNFVNSVSDAGVTTIDGNGAIVSRSFVNSTPNFIFLYLDGQTASIRLRDLTISNFRRDGGGSGGAILGWVTGDYTLDVEDTRFILNNADNTGGAVSCGSPDSTCNFTRSAFLQNSAIGGSGGALSISGTGTISNSAFFGNVSGGDGGALTLSDKAYTISNTTFANNYAAGSGSAIRTYDANVSAFNVTITNNTADSDQNGTGNGSFSRNSAEPVETTFYNSIIADNQDLSPNVNDKKPDYFGVLNANTRNTIIGNNNGMTGITNGINGNQVGTPATPLDPRLTCVFPRPGGINPACVPLGNSPAINAGDNNYQPGSLDTRGVRRRLYGTIDIGAAEFKRPDSPVVTNAANQAWLFRYTNTAGSVDMNFLYGQGLSDYNPIVGDWNGDGIDTQGVYTRFNNNNIGVFALSNTFNSFDVNTLPAFVYTDASPNWIPVSGDWEGNTADSVGAYNVATGVWVLTNSNASVTPTYSAFVFGGGAGIVPVTGDWDGNGTDRIGVYNFNSSTWVLSNAIGAGAPVELSFTYGAPGSYPIVGDWDGDGVDTVGLYNPVSGQWLLRNTNTTGAANVAFVYGQGAGLRGDAGQWKQVTQGNGTTPIRESSVTPDVPQIAPTFAP